MENEDSKFLQEFTNLIDNWVTTNGIIYPSKFEHEEINKILSMQKTEFGDLDRNDCVKYIFILNQYLTHLNFILAKEKAIQNWAEQFMSFLVHENTDLESHMYKEKRVYLTTKKSSLYRNINKLKIHNDGHIFIVEGQISSIENFIKILERKLYERSS